MSKQVVSNGLIRLGGYDLTADINAIALSQGADALEITSLADLTHVYQPGLKTVKCSIKGFWKVTEDAAIIPDLSVTDVVSLALTPTEGGAGYFMQSMQAQYQTFDQVGKIMPMSLTLQAAGALTRGTILANKAAIAATGTGSPFQLGAASASQSLLAALHVTGITGTGVSLTVTLESDSASNFPSPLTVATFTAVTDVTGVGGQYAAVAGASTDTWYRAKYTISGTGTFDFTVLGAIANTH